MNKESFDRPIFPNGNVIPTPYNSWFSDVFANIKSKGMKVGIEGYGNRFTLDVSKEVDLVVTFRDNVDNLTKNCGAQGVGVFCQNNQLTNAEITEINNAMDSGEISKFRFAAVVYSGWISKRLLLIRRFDWSFLNSIKYHVMLWN